MLKYREFLSLTDEEVRFILNEIFQPVKVENIKRDKEWNEITAEMTTDGWGVEEDSDETTEITDVIELTVDGMNVDFSLTSEDILKYQQFLLAKGCDERLKNNPYMNT